MRYQIDSIFKQLLLLSTMLAMIGMYLAPNTSTAQPQSDTTTASEKHPDFFVRPSHSLAQRKARNINVWRGYEVEIIKRLAELAKLNPVFITDYNWPRSYNSLKFGSIHGLTQVTFHHDRVPEVDFLFPFDTEKLVIIALKKNAHQRFEDLNMLLDSGVKIGKVTGTRFSESLEKQMQQQPNIDKTIVPIYPSTSDDPNWFYKRVLNDVFNGRMFGIVINEFDYSRILAFADSGYHTEEDALFEEISSDDFIAIKSPIFDNTLTFFAAAKGYPKRHKEALVKAYCQMHANHEIKAIRAKWSITPTQLPISSYNYPSHGCKF